MNVRNAATVEIEPIRWLWNGRIPEAKLTIVGGDTGDGKSFLVTDFAARMSSGRDWPDGCPCPQGRVLLVNTEDDAGDTIAPRLQQAEADRNQILIYDGMTVLETGQPDRLDLKRDIAAIEEKLVEFPDIRMLIVDPVGSFSAENFNEYHRMYGMLAPLNELAAKHNVAILGILHMSKSETAIAKHRLSGSTAIVAAARCAWCVLRDPDSDDRRRRLFLPLKQNNSAGEDVGLAFRITSDEPDGVAHVEWLDEAVEVSADEVLKRQAAKRGEQTGEGSERSEAVAFLREVLKDGPVPATEIEKQAKQWGTSLSACRRQKGKLKIQVRKVGMDGGWHWSLPHEDDHEDNQAPLRAR